MCSHGVESPSHHSQGALHTKHRQTAVLSPARKDFQDLGAQQESLGKTCLSQETQASSCHKCYHGHCFSLMETNSSGPNCGCNRVNTMLGPRCDGATSISKGSIPRPPMGKGVMGCSPSSPCMARAKGWDPRREMGPQQRACGRGRRGLKSHFKGNQKQPLLML